MGKSGRFGPLTTMALKESVWVVKPVPLGPLQS